MASKPKASPAGEPTEPTRAASPSWEQQLETLRELAQVVQDHNLSELEVEHSGVQISFKSQPPTPAASSLSPELLAALLAGGSGATLGTDYTVETTTQTTVTPVEAPVAKGTPVVSPMVGLFYRAPSPNDPNFVEVGDRVEIGQTLGLVETMKVFNEITSEIEGTVLDIKHGNGDLVETGDVLMTIG